MFLTSWLAAEGGAWESARQWASMKKKGVKGTRKGECSRKNLRKTSVPEGGNKAGSQAWVCAVVQCGLVANRGGLSFLDVGNAVSSARRGVGSKREENKGGRTRSYWRAVSDGESVSTESLTPRNPRQFEKRGGQNFLHPEQT